MKDSDGRPASAEQLLGRRVRALRSARGWSQDDLAEAMRAAGFTWLQSTAAKTELGDRPIRLNEAAHLARVFAVDLDALVQPEMHAIARRIQIESVRVEAAAAAEQSAQAQHHVTLLQLEDRRRFLEALRRLAIHIEAPEPAALPDIVEAIVVMRWSNGEWREILSDAGFDEEALRSAELGASGHAGETSTPRAEYGRMIGQELARSSSPEPAGAPRDDDGEH